MAAWLRWLHTLLHSSGSKQLFQPLKRLKQGKAGVALPFFCAWTSGEWTSRHSQWIGVRLGKGAM